MCGILAGPTHEVRVEELGGSPSKMAREIRALLRSGPLHLHGSPPCQKLSNISMQRMDVAEGSTLPTASGFSHLTFSTALEIGSFAQRRVS